jgi:hypothetical protein
MSQIGVLHQRSGNDLATDQGIPQPKHGTDANTYVQVPALQALASHIQTEGT